MKIELCDGKYTWHFNEATGEQYAERNGLEWRDLVGDNLTLAMGMRITELEEALAGMHEDLFCEDI